jgi:hypothetical protein
MRSAVVVIMKGEYSDMLIVNSLWMLDVRATLLVTLSYCAFREHPFKLCYKAEDNFDSKYYWFFCHADRNLKHWFYYCETLNFSIHPD